MLHKVKYLFKRFVEMNRAYRPNSSSLKRFMYFIDWVFSFIIYGASISDYFTFGFPELNYLGRRKYITYRKHKKIQRIANDKRSIDVCRYKSHFNKNFKRFLGRETIDVSEVSRGEFIQWVRKINGNIFVKDAYGYRGKGVKKVNVVDIEPGPFYDELIQDKKSKYIIEQELIQDRSIAEFHPWSVNTIRITTLYDTKRDTVCIMDAGLRIGNNKKHVDNLHYGGIYCRVDIQTGVICDKGFNTKNQRFVYHPLTNKQIVGFKIENWDGLLEYVRKAVRMLRKVRYVGWDVVVLEDGGFALIEANDNADHDLQQMYRGGLWQDYKKILKRL